GDAVECRRGGAEVVVKRERESFFNADPTGLDVAVSEGRSNQLGGAFILLPNTDFCRIAKRLAHACLFKGRRNDDGIASPRNDESEEPFAGPPTDTGEVYERGTGSNQQGLELGIGLRHQFLGTKDTCAELLGRDGVNALAKRFEGREGRWKLPS